MKVSGYLLALSLLIITGIFLAGCNSYAEPDIKMNTKINQVNVSPETNNITYDVTVDLTNTGSNNAYGVTIMVLLSTPKDNANYRFVNENVDIGTINKGDTVNVTKRLELQMTPDNYELLSQNHRQPEVETKLTRVSSSVLDEKIT
jgi:hypothetical protein